MSNIAPAGKPHQETENRPLSPSHREATIVHVRCPLCGSTEDYRLAGGPPTERFQALECHDCSRDIPP
jgi:hypothetical protein